MVRKPVGDQVRPLVETGTHQDPLVISPGRPTVSSTDGSANSDVTVRALVESLPGTTTDGIDRNP